MLPFRVAWPLTRIKTEMSAEPPPAKAVEVPKAAVPKVPQQLEAPVPKADSKQQEVERKRKLSESSQLAGGIDEFSAPFKPPPGKYVIITDVSLGAQAVFDRLEGGLKCQRSEKVEVVPLVSGIADLCAYHAERALKMYDDEVTRGVGNPQTQVQDMGFIAKYRKRRPQIGFTSPNVGWLSRSFGTMTLPTGEKCYSGGPGFVDEMDDVSAAGPLVPLEVGQNGIGAVIQRLDLPASYQDTWLAGK